ncbi:MAG TPA: carboxymuconolactone decarboxylase family protein [Bacillota bacterium]|nr:carboxymuconolactone decarboxylase family protein [Bacillota bacterium]
MAGQLPPFVEKFAVSDRELYDKVAEVREIAYPEDGLDRKTAILITLAIDAFKGAAGGVASLAKQARAAGATEEEIKQAIRIAYYVAGMQTLAAGSAAFDE